MYDYRTQYGLAPKPNKHYGCIICVYGMTQKPKTACGRCRKQLARPSDSVGARLAREVIKELNNHEV